jgi:hypothetical protein
VELPVDEPEYNPEIDYEPEPAVTSPVEKPDIIERPLPELPVEEPEYNPEIDYEPEPAVTSPVGRPDIIEEPLGTVLTGPLVQGTDYPTNWQNDTGKGTVEVKPMIGPDGKPMDNEGSTFSTTLFGSPDSLLMTPEDLAAQKQKEDDADYADELNVYNIQKDADEIQKDINNLDYLNDLTKYEAEKRDYQHKLDEVNNINNINAGITAINNQEAANTALTDNATRQANYQGALTDYYAANPNAVQYTDDYGRGITSTIPDVAPNVFPVTGGSDYGTGVVGFDYNPDPYVGVHYDDAANRYAQEMTQANDFGGYYGGDVGGGGRAFNYGDVNMSEFARGGIASLPKSPGQKLLAAHRAGDMATVHRMLRKVRR